MRPMNLSLEHSTLTLAFLAAFAVSAAACSDPESTSGAGGQGSTSSSSGAGGSTSSSSTDAAGGGPGGAGGSGGGAFDFCAAIATRDASCGESDAANCDGTRACFESMMAPADVEGALKCLAERSCDTSDDSCIAEVQAKHQDEPARKSVSEACMTKYEECKSGDSFADDHCFSVFVVKEALVADYSACFEMACGEISDCIAGLEAPACAN